jgi:hypothetical protein
MRVIQQTILPVLALSLLAGGCSREAGQPTPQAAAGTSAPWGAAYATNQAGTTIKSPIADFRELLAMDAVAREKALQEKSEKYQAWFHEKQAEYANLSATERELRLRTTELRWYLLPLMRVAADQRGDWASSIPAVYHGHIESRLQQWDKLSAERRNEVLDNELTIAYFGRFEAASSEQRKMILARMSQGRREKLEQDLKSFRSLASEKRERLLSQFSEFFDLNEREKSRILGELPNSERGQIARDLQALENLPADQRAACLKSLEKFASMTAEQQLVFMNNAQEWQKLSATEKQLWRNLVTELPPSPPGLGGPPMPPGFGGEPTIEEITLQIAPRVSVRP